MREHQPLGGDLALDVRVRLGPGVRQRLVAVLDVPAVKNDAGRADVHQPSHAGLVDGIQHIARAVAIDAPDVLCRTPVNERGAVHDAVDAVTQHRQFRVADVHLDEGRPVRARACIGCRRVRRRAQVDGGDLVARGRQPVHDCRADEPAASRDEEASRLWYQTPGPMSAA